VLPERPWKFEAILRLLLSVFVCHFFGTVVVTVTVMELVGRGPHDRAGIFFALVFGCTLCCGLALFVLRKPWELDRFMHQFIALLVSLNLALILGALAQSVAGKPGLGNLTWHTLAAALSFQGVAIVFTARLVREHGMRWAEAFGLHSRWPTALLFGGLAAGLFLPVGWLLQMASAELMSRAHLKTEIQPAVQALQHTVTWLDRVIMGVVTIGIAPVAEELLFRGILYPAIRQAGFPGVALWGTSLLFAAIHVNLGIFVPLLLLALILARLYERTGNLLAPITAHALFNAFNFARFFFLESLFNQPG
jgi:membrane protease YdiL (CAAX protease family)